jgi:hypothetical protein
MEQKVNAVQTSVVFLAEQEKKSQQSSFFGLAQEKDGGRSRKRAVREPNRPLPMVEWFTQPPCKPPSPSHPPDLRFIFRFRFVWLATVRPTNRLAFAIDPGAPGEGDYRAKFEAGDEGQG